MNEIVARIDELRKKKGLTKKALMKKMNITPSTLNNWYYADVTPSLANIDNFCKAIDITIEQFFIGVGSKNSQTLNSQFMEDWNLLSDTEKTAILKVIEAFKAIR